MMRLCPQCSRSSWPFGVALLISLVIAFITWLVLGLSDMEPLMRVALTAVAFGAVGMTLLHYVVTCLKRHCRHDHAHGAAHSHSA